MGAVLQDVRFALRGWRKAPGFALAIIATLGLGIGANTAIFSVVSGVLLRPMPFPHSDRLVQVDEMQPQDKLHGGFDGGVVYRDLEEWRTQNHLMEGMASYLTSSRNLQGIGDTQQVSTVAAEQGLFTLLGVPALAGRTFGKGDPLNTVVVSYRFWNKHFGGDWSAVGRGIMLDGELFTLIGVMPAGFTFPYESSSADMWTPWRVSEELRSHPRVRLQAVLGRLKEGATPEAARQELNAADGLIREHRVVRVKRMKDVVSAPARKPLLVLLGAVGMLLLLTCLNIANLLLSRTASREREIVIRAALGASRFRLIQQFLTESLLLAIAGGVAGFGIGVWACQILVRIAATQIPRAAEIGLDWRVFTFLLMVSLATGIGFGLGPAIAGARSRAGVRKDRAVRSSLRDALVVGQVALAFILLAGAGLLSRTFLNLLRTNLGLNPENVLTMHIVASSAQEVAAIQDRVANVPGVHAVGVISFLPLQNFGWSGFFTFPGHPALLKTELRYVTPGYFTAMGIPLRRGRDFTLWDGPGSHVIVINEALARQYFAGEDPIGRHTDRGAVIGVVGDVRQETLSVPAVPEIYYPMAQNFAQISGNGSTLVVKANGSVSALAAAIREVVRRVNPGQALFRVATMQEVIDESLASPRMYMWLLVLFASMGTVQAAIGIYGVIAYLVALRTHEFGIRLALGADTGQVLRVVMNRGARMIGFGLALGIGGAAALTKVLRGALYGVAATDPATFSAVALILAVVALAACLIPARRAALVDPAVALRSE